MRVRLEFKADKIIECPRFWVGIVNNDEVKVTGTYYCKERAGSYAINGNGTLECVFKQLLLRPDTYHLMVGIYDEYGQIAYDRIGRVHTFKIKDVGTKGFEKYYGYGAPGVMNLHNQWTKLVD